jgi:cytochrome c2
VILDRTSGRALYVVLSSGGFLGWDRNRVLVPYNLLSFTGQWDNPTLNVAASKIENAPRVTEGDLGTLLHDPDWRRAVSDYFGIALADNAGSAGGGERPPSGPREAPPSGPAAQNAPPSGPHVPSNPTGPTSDPKASPGEGATGPTAAGGAPGAAQTSTAMAMPTAGAASGGGADPHHGQTVAQHVCAACHTLNQGGTTRVGPNLFGIGERGIASLPGYNYSAALKGHQGNWEPQQLDAFLKSPRGYAPGTYMTFPGISSDRDRRDVVAYLESLK